MSSHKRHECAGISDGVGTRTRRAQDACEVEQGEVLRRATRIADRRSIVGDNADGLAGVGTDVSSYRVRVAAETEAVPIRIVGQRAHYVINQARRAAPRRCGKLNHHEGIQPPELGDVATLAVKGLESGVLLSSA